MLTKEKMDSITRLRCIKDLYSRLTALLTLKQYAKLMGGDMSYKSKAERAKRVSKSRRVHDLADYIIQLQNEISKTE